MPDAYDGRGQTAAKHFILRRYLQALAYKLMHGGHPAISYVDGFSGPWESQTSDHSDTSFMIALGVLKEAQRQVREATGYAPEVRCFFAEVKPSSYAQLKAAVAQYHDPTTGFYVRTYQGRFEDAVDDVLAMIEGSFALTFIDPTGWTGYEFPKIRRLLQHRPGEVLLNYMQPFIDRFTNWDEPTNTATFNGILGDGWQGRLDRSLPRSEAALSLFTDQLRDAGPFHHVVSTPIEKDEGQAGFRIVYGTRSDRGLEAYRDAEHDALRNQDVRRTAARKAEWEATGIIDMFPDEAPELPIERKVAEACVEGRRILLDQLANMRSCRFGELWPTMLAGAMIRKTNAKDICVTLASEGVIKPSWKARGPRIRKPDDDDMIGLTS